MRSKRLSLCGKRFHITQYIWKSIPIISYERFAFAKWAFFSCWWGKWALNMPFSRMKGKKKISFWWVTLVLCNEASKLWGCEIFLSWQLYLCFWTVTGFIASSCFIHSFFHCLKQRKINVKNAYIGKDSRLVLALQKVN